MVTAKRIAAAVLGVLAVVLVPVALFPATVPRPLPEPNFACATIDWRIGAKLHALRDRDDARTRAIVNSTIHQREAARAQCWAGQVDAAMDIYRVLDRALTRYVQHGTSPTLPN
jgi:hypothetical protein